MVKTTDNEYTTCGIKTTSTGTSTRSNALGNNSDTYTAMLQKIHPGPYLYDQQGRLDGDVIVREDVREKIVVAHHPNSLAHPEIP